MDKRSDVKEKAFTLFFRLLEMNTKDFSEAFWKEIFSQIIYPLLEDIHLAASTPNKTHDAEFFKKGIEDILVKLNQFLAKNLSSLKHLVPSYIDIISLFISNISQKNIA
mmetsp:Transcript_22235/g.16670  ORF Transcript_22235/g.16670 Transcript_22235/m.16670 type:complete len:109 (+) Transcript_22235:1414-1740(+)